MLEARFCSNGNSEYLQCDQYAYLDTGTYSKPLKAASFSGTQSQINAAKAMLHSKRPSIVIDGVYLQADEKFEVRISKLPKYRMANMCIRAKDESLCIGDMVETVRDYIFGSQISTPMLEEWIPWVVNKLYSESRITPLRCYGGISAYLCQFKSQYLDEVVAQGIKYGHLKIPQSDRLACA